jgi:2-amino-4-hydroxy-6-hydroxymethyldihydropteridine diphosphokinase
VVTGGVYIALGSNLGDRAAHINGALRDLQAADDVSVLRCSSIHETEPVGGPSGQGMYLNAVAELDTSLSPRQLLTLLHEIEHRHGRVRDVPHGPRTLDLDLLLFRDLVIDEPDLHVPHPRIWSRPFVVRPLSELLEVQHVH